MAAERLPPPPRETTEDTIHPLVSWALRRPIATTAFYLLIALLALLAYLRLPVALLPSVRFPGVVVWTPFPEASPERVERMITEPVERAVGGVRDLRRISSRSQIGGSLVRADFGWDTDIGVSQLEVREQLDRLAGTLPDSAGQPIVLGFDPGAMPILTVALLPADEEERSSDLLHFKRLGREVVSRRLEQIGGVSQVQVTGGFERVVEVEVVPDRLNAYGLDLQTIRDALRRANVSLSGGMVRRGPFRYSIEVSGEFRDLDEIADTVVSSSADWTVRVRDVARVAEGRMERRGLVRLDGRECLLLLIERRADSNTVETAGEVRAALTSLEAELPGIRLLVVDDASRTITASIRGLGQTLLLGSVLAVAVLLLFLRRARDVLTLALAVPLSLILTLVLFDALAIQLTIVSLSGLVLGIGMLLDNSIVVIESIARRRESGMSRRSAAGVGTSEVIGAITASTFTTIVVFLPLTLVEGLAGRLFRDQSLAIVCSLSASLLVAMTAVPVSAARGRDQPGTSQRDIGVWLEVYERWLRAALHRRGAVLAAVALWLAAAVWLAGKLPRRVIPEIPGERIELELAVPPASDLARLDDCSTAIESALLGRAEVGHVMADLGVRDSGWLSLDPRPSNRGELTILMRRGEEVTPLIAALRHLRVPAECSFEARPERTSLETLLTSDGPDLEVDLVADTRSAARRVQEDVLTRLADRPQLLHVRHSHEETLPAYQLQLDRMAIARLGLAVDSVSEYLEAGARGLETTALKSVNDEVPILVRLRSAGSLEALLAQRVKTAEGSIALGSLLQVRQESLPMALIREDQKPVVRLTADIAPDADIAGAIGAVESVLRKTLPGNVRGRVRGANETFRTALRAVGWSLLLSTVLVFLILTAQFESLLQPLVVLAAVPLGIAGVVFALRVTGQSANLMSLTGCVVLVGIAVNDAILKVDRVNWYRCHGRSAAESLTLAGRDRARPIVMTTLTTLFGLLPLATGLGAGSAMHAPMAIAIIGGLAAATVLTLVVVPVIYDVVILGECSGRGKR